MTPLDPKTCEQLCAWMDGELPAEEARFLERRLEHDVELRETWERYQLASSCIRGQSLQLMRPDLKGRIQASIAAPEPAGSRRRPVWGWAIAASIAALAVMIGVQIRPEKNDAHPEVAARAVEAPALPISASPASADLVALTTNQPIAGGSETDSPVVTRAARHPVASERPSAPVALQSPIPLNIQSPTEFPLMETSASKAWPRSPLASASDPSMEAYLVRHNEMVNDGGLGGFVPYVDVVTRDDGTPDSGAARASEDDQQ